MNDTEYTKTCPHFLIAGYGVEGITAAALLEHSEWLASVENRQHCINFMKLGEETNIKRIPDILTDIDMVFILGGYDDIAAPPAALELAEQCKEKGIICLTALTIIATPGHIDIATDSLCNLSSNVLRNRFERPVDNCISCYLLNEAVLNIIDLLLSKGMVGIDFEDVKMVLKKGHTAHFGIGTSKGKDRAIHAVKMAFTMLPKSINAKGILCKITAGASLNFDEFENVTAFISAQYGEDCFFIAGTAFYENMEDEIKISLTALC